MKIIVSIIGLGLLMVSGFVNAGIWYKWHATNNDVPRKIELLLEFSPEVVSAGSFQMQIEAYDLNASYPQSGLLSLRYSPGTEGGGIYWTPRTGINYPGPTILDMSVQFNPGRHVTGRIYAFNFDSMFSMATDTLHGPNFTIYDAESDAGMNGCGFTTGYKVPCYGATGQIRQIPEPGSVALLGLGVLGLIAARRKTAKL